MTPSKQPNLVLLLADQLRYQACGYAGETRAQTPHIDQLAHESVNFENAVSVYPLCGPMRASLFTGKYPTSTGFFRNDIRCMPDPDAIGHVLTNSGYETAYIGKWHLYGSESDEQYIPPGPYRLGFDDYWASYAWNIDYWNGRYFHDTPDEVPMTGFQTDYLTTLALNAMEKRDQSRPFALFLSYEVPHPPLERDNVPEEYYAMFEDVDFSDFLYAIDEPFEQFTPAYDRAWQRENIIDKHQERCRAYYAMIACLDHNVGRVMQYLAANNLEEDTILVFTSDHGEMLGAHGRGNKRIFYEQSIRVPFLIRWSGKTPSGISSDRLLNTPDIAPTLIDLMGLSVPDSMEGFSYAPTALGQVQSDSPEYMYMQALHGSTLNHHEEWRGMRSADFIYAKMLRTGKEYLFNHRVDPDQLKNLVDDPGHQTILNNLRGWLLDAANRLGDDMHLPEWYEDNWIQDGCVVRSATRRLDLSEYPISKSE